MIADVLGVYRSRPGPLLGWALAVFLPLTAVRFVAVDARVYPVALALTLLGHLVLAAVYWRLRQSLGVRPLRGGTPALVLGLLVLTAAQIPVGLAVEAVVGRSAFGITFGGLVGSLLLGPAWALLVAGWLRTRQRSPGRAVQP